MQNLRDDFPALQRHSVRFRWWSKCLSCQSVARLSALDQSAVMECGYHAGKQPDTCWICGETYPRPSASLSDSLPASGVKRQRNSGRVASPAKSRHSSRVSWSDSPRAVGVQSVQPVNEGNSNDASRISVESAGSCGTKLSSEEARAPSELHESAHSIMSERLAVSSGFLVEQVSWRISPSHLVGLVEKIHISRNKCFSRSLRYTRLLHTSTRFNLKFSLQSSLCHVPRTMPAKMMTGPAFLIWT